MIRLLVFSHLLKLFHFKMPICHFQSMGMGWMWGGGYGSGPVFLISVMSYHYMIFVAMSVYTACTNVVGSPDGQAICLGAQVHMPPMNCLHLCACVPFFMAWQPHSKCDSQS